MSDPDGKFAALALAPFIPGVGEFMIAGGIAAIGVYAIYGVTNAILNRDSYGGRYAGQVQTINEKTSGLNQSPGGFEEWNPKNLGNGPKWAIGLVGGLGLGVLAYDKYQEFKDAVNGAKEFKQKSEQKTTEITNKNSPTQTQLKKTIIK